MRRSSCRTAASRLAWLGGALLVVHATPTLASAQRGTRAFADSAGRVHVVTAAGHETVIAQRRGQSGVGDVRVSEDGRAVGWLALYPDPASSSPAAEALLVWRQGRRVRTFTSEQVFWSWAFLGGGRRVAYHTGPTHGERTSHCELRDVATGKLVASWDGDLQSPNRPAWTRGLDH